MLIVHGMPTHFNARAYCWNHGVAVYTYCGLVRFSPLSYVQFSPAADLFFKLWQLHVSYNCMATVKSG